MTRAENTARQRDGHYCQRCGRSILSYPSSLHHRQPKGMGGSLPVNYDKPSNLVRLCGSGSTPDCHAWVHQHPAQSYEHGWLVRRNSVDDPEQIPLFGLSGGRFFLTDDGGRIDIGGVL